MDVNLEVNWIKNKLDNISDPSLIEAIKRIILRSNDVVSEPSAEYITSYNNDLELSEKEIVEGDLLTEDEVLELVKKWQE